ncbi:MAG: helix-turn-helix transcriptional regulator [Candidatus Hodarchaeota archaeon]
MWLGKFLDLEEDIKSLRSRIKKGLFDSLKKDKLTPLEFTIIETIFNSKEQSGYDLINNLNKQFAGTWEAHSGTIYPILRKLENSGFLKSRTVKSPIGPLRKVYSLTEAGETILKHKVNKNYLDQLKFTENFLVELSSIYIRSFPEEEKEEIIKDIKSLLKEAFENVMKNIPPTLEFKAKCQECGSEINREAQFCPNCGTTLLPSIEENK